MGKEGRAKGSSCPRAFDRKCDAKHLSWCQNISCCRRRGEEGERKAAMRPATFTRCMRRCLCSNSQGAPIRVGYTAKAGRGVFAVRDIADGELIHTADPVVAHPSIQSLHKACYFCLKGMKSDSSSTLRTAGAGVSNIFCSRKCEDSAQGFYAIEKQADWSEFHDYCSTNGVRFPLVAKRLACMVASSATSVHTLDILSYVNLAHGFPPAWGMERDFLLKALNTKGVNHRQPLDFLTEDWYAGVLARLHINAFRVERISDEDSEDMLAAAAASILGDNIVGSAVYVLPSMYNHDCDPNVDILWPINATARLVACRRIQADEELRITYIDASMAQDVRRKFLEEHYGFICNCARCRDGD